MKGLTVRQRKFVEAFTGNASEAARKAGYKGNDQTVGVTAHHLLKNPKVRAAIESRESKRTNQLIATRQQRQEFWTKVMQNGSEDMNARLKASELLGKSEADFTDKLDATLHQPEPLVFVPAKPNAPGSSL